VTLPRLPNRCSCLTLTLAHCMTLNNLHEAAHRAAAGCGPVSWCSRACSWRLGCRPHRAWSRTSSRPWRGQSAATSSSTPTRRKTVSVPAYKTLLATSIDSPDYTAYGGKLALCLLLWTQNHCRAY